MMAMSRPRNGSLTLYTGDANAGPEIPAPGGGAFFPRQRRASLFGRDRGRRVVTKGALIPAGYTGWLVDLKARICEAWMKAAVAVNRELVLLYWQIGSVVLERRGRDGWGTKAVERLAADLRVEFPVSRGFASADLRYKRAFAEAWPDPAICQRIFGKLPWGRDIALSADLAEALPSLQELEPRVLPDPREDNAEF